MDTVDLQKPVFATYVIAATIMILKAVSMSWLTVFRMMQAKGGFRSPEDIKKAPLNPEPDPKQLAPNERGRAHQAHPAKRPGKRPLLSGGGLPLHFNGPIADGRAITSLWLLSRLLHFGAYFTAQTHDMRATFWTVGSLT